MKANLNKNKVNFRSIYKSKHYNRRYNEWIEEYFYDYKTVWYFRNLRHRRNKVQASIIGKSLSSIPDNYDDIKLSRNYRSWKDRTKRKHQYKIIEEDNFKTVFYDKNI